MSKAAQSQENDLDTEKTVEISFDFWPFRSDGPFPDKIFSADHIDHIVFVMWPIMFKCGVAAIRGGLKSHLKRHCPQLLKKHEAGQIDQNISLANQFALNPQSRVKARELNFLVEQPTIRFGRPATKNKTLEPKQSFGELLGQSYSLDPDVTSLFEWFQTTAQPRKKNGLERYLTASLLKYAIRDGKCPRDTNSIEFARMILIYASVLDCPGEQIELVESAIEVGCLHLEELLLREELKDESEQVVDHEMDPGSRSDMQQKATLPMLNLIGAAVPRERDTELSVLASTNSLKLGRVAIDVALEAAKVYYGETIEALISLSDERWMLALSAAQSARNSYKEHLKNRMAVSQQEELNWKVISDYLNMEFQSLNLEKLDDAQLISSTIEVSKIRCALEDLAPSFNQLDSWRNRVEDFASVSALHELVAICEVGVTNNNARNIYKGRFEEYIKCCGVEVVSNVLLTLNSEQLGALISQVNNTLWNIGDAIILRAALDKSETPPESVLLALINADPVSRRVLLSFVDGEHNSIQSSLLMRRIMAVERFRTIMLFEPIAQILDPTSKLMSVDVVGRNVYDLADILRTNATIIGTSQDISRLIRHSPSNAEAYEALLAFSKKAVTMQGNYRRLKEKARESLDKHVLNVDDQNDKNLISFLSYIKSGQLAADVISELCAERTDIKLETRHKEQLARYISQMEILLQDCISESQHRPDARLRSLATKIKRLYRQLRSSSNVGSIEWLEGQVADILVRPRREASVCYLREVAGSTIESAWTSEETDFASQYIDLPEFHYSKPVFFKDIAASCLFWRAQSKQPSELQIANVLVDSNQVSAAISFSKERNDPLVSELIEKISLPICNRLADRAVVIKKQYGAGVVERLEEYALFNSALEGLELDSAADALDLLELVASESAVNEVQSSDIAERKMLVQKMLSKFEVLGASEDLATIEARWAVVLQTNALKRVHLTTVEKVFEQVQYLPSYLENMLATFKEENEFPERWLEEKLALEFSEYTQEAAERLTFWARSAHIMIPRETKATYIICEWFIRFIVERALSMNQLEEAEGLASAMDRVFDVSATIINAMSPAECAVQLKETGELPEGFAKAIQDESAEHKLAQRTSKIIEHRPVASERLSGTRLNELVRAENWPDAMVLVRDSSSKIDDFDLNGVFSVFLDTSPQPSGSVIDNLQSAASWLSGSQELAIQLSEGQRLSLAYQVLSGAIAAESNEEIPRVTAANGGWSDILGKSSAFRKMLVGSIPFRVEKVLETLLSGNLNLSVAEKLWDAATNINDPHLLRSPILSFMYEHGASEAVCRLASRHDSAIASRLSQLFELRAVASVRPDLIPVVQSVADQIVNAAKSVPFRNFVKELPTATHAVKPNLALEYEGDLSLHDSKRNAVFELPVTVTPNGLVPTKLEANLFEGDDVYFEDGSLRYELSNRPTYFASDFTLRIKFGASWFAKNKSKDGVRVRIRAKTLTDELFAEDIVFRARSVDPKVYNGVRLSTDTLLDLYPGVSNTPAIEETFIGRHDEIELLNQVLVSARRPSPVLLTGMRRIGKTSLLFAFHKRLRQPGNATAITFYLSLAERRVEFVTHERPVSATLFRAISHGLVRPNLSVTDQNYALCSRIRQRFDGDWKQARNSIQECYDEESLSDSLIALSSKLIEWVGCPLERFVLLIDEAEALVAPYQAGGEKRLELEQLLQSLREVSQTTGSIGILLSGSNHINVFAREYKNAFFGSSQSIELTGLKDAKEAAALIAPKRVSAFIQFDSSAVEYAFSLCAGMPQFLWQVGATVAHLVRVGPATKRDVRLAVSALVGNTKSDLPFKAYEILEPIDSILSLESARERDLLWMLLYRIASASSLVAEDATIPFVIDQALASLDERPSWNRRLRSLVDLKILRMESVSTVRFHVPLFGEGFRAHKNWQEYNARLQGVSQ